MQNLHFVRCRLVDPEAAECSNWSSNWIVPPAPPPPICTPGNPSPLHFSPSLLTAGSINSICFVLAPWGWSCCRVPVHVNTPVWVRVCMCMRMCVWKRASGAQCKHRKEHLWRGRETERDRKTDRGKTMVPETDKNRSTPGDKINLRC